MTPDQQQNPDDYQQILEIYKMCFREYAAAMEWTTEDMVTKSQISGFVRWCRGHNMPTRDKEAFAAAGISPHVVDLVSEEVIHNDDFAAVASLIPCWSAICMSGRPPLDPRPILTAVSIAMQFDDGMAFQVQTPTEYDETLPRTEGFILSLMEEQFRQIIHTCKTQGFPALLEKYGMPVPKELPTGPENETGSSPAGEPPSTD